MNCDLWLASLWRSGSHGSQVSYVLKLAEINNWLFGLLPIQLYFLYRGFIICKIETEKTHLFPPVVVLNLLRPVCHSFRCIERLKAKNERLTAGLERRRVESEQISLTVRRLEADCSALQAALRYRCAHKTLLTHRHWACLRTYAYSASMHHKILTALRSAIKQH